MVSSSKILLRSERGREEADFGVVRFESREEKEWVLESKKQALA